MLPESSLNNLNFTIPAGNTSEHIYEIQVQWYQWIKL